MAPDDPGAGTSHRLSGIATTVRRLAAPCAYLPFAISLYVCRWRCSDGCWLCAYQQIRDGKDRSPLRPSQAPRRNWKARTAAANPVDHLSLDEGQESGHGLCDRERSRDNLAPGRKASAHPNRPPRGATRGGRQSVGLYPNPCRRSRPRLWF